jgi:hypothetical protein
MSTNSIIFKRIDVVPTSSAYKRMSSGWQKTYDQLQSAEYVRDLGQIYIPKFPKETDAQYKQRLKRTFPQSFIKDVTNNLCSRPLSKPVKVSNEPQQLEAIKYDADLLGSDVTMYAKQIFLHALRYGMAFTLVDYSNVVPENLAIQQELQQRPNFNFIPAYNMLNYKSDMQANGTSILTEITYRSTEDINGKLTEIINVMNADGEWYKYVISNNELELFASGEHTYRGIPLSTLYVNRTNFMESDIPFESIVDKNIEFTQVSSDYNNLITHVQIPILFGKNFEEQEMNITISPSSFIHSVNDKSDLKYVEHSGKGAEVGARRLEAIAEEIGRLAGIPLTQRTQDMTATGAYIRHSNASTDLQSWALALEHHLYECYKIAANWVNTDLADDFMINVFMDWVISGNNTDIQTLMDLNEKGLLSDATTLEEIKRRGLFSNTFDVNAELEKVNENLEEGN